MKLIPTINIILSLLATTVRSGRPYYISPPSQLTQPPPDSLATVQSGNYLITGCGPKATTIATVLQHLWTGLQTALKTPPTSTAYTKFFSGVDPNVVNTVLAKIALGADVPSNGQSWQPTIICANPDMPQIAAHWDLCQHSIVQGSHQKNTQYVFLCPRIFDLKLVPDATDCVGRRPGGMFSTGQGLARSVMAVLLHELVHMYLDPKHLPRDFYGLHAVLDLSPGESVINPPNYVFYVASMYGLICIVVFVFCAICADGYLYRVDIMAQCTTFKPPESLRPPERILSDGGFNETSYIDTIYNDTIYNNTSSLGENIKV